MGQEAAIGYVWVSWYPFDKTQPIAHVAVYIFEMFAGEHLITQVLSKIHVLLNVGGRSLFSYERILVTPVGNLVMIKCFRTLRNPSALTEIQKQSKTLHSTNIKAYSEKVSMFFKSALSHSNHFGTLIYYPFTVM